MFSNRYFSKKDNHEKQYFFLLFVLALLLACNYKSEKSDAVNLKGTWQLLSATTITKGVEKVTNYTQNQQMIKIINDTHFAFLNHHLNTAKDSSNHFDAGGEKYTLKGNQYVEHLDYYADKNWEGKMFNFTVTLKNDTLIQKGIEKLEKENIDRVIIEKYVRLK
ncbi:hypothetical protein [Mucilaginibacter arboris]|uniref:Lipocalin-like domain-containing protein n=1 Tax=Mucilaginibacter arboris TaxID=2682090 RepID=A0A7K1T1G0_9SPHI|nr:hypothetical protein [Mucilaginibacter arboris]MVN23341.1 hypothetical protein [Mucilaginibacter arboris]